MNIEKPEDALRLPKGQLQLTRETDLGRVCERREFSEREVLDAASKLISIGRQEPDFANQAEIIASCTNAVGIESASEAFAYSEVVGTAKSATRR